MQQNLGLKRCFRFIGKEIKDFYKQYQGNNGTEFSTSDDRFSPVQSKLYNFYFPSCRQSIDFVNDENIGVFDERPEASQSLYQLQFCSTFLDKKTKAAKFPVMVRGPRFFRIFRRILKRRSYDPLASSKQEVLEAGIEFTKRTKEYKTDNLRRNAICEIDIVERAGVCRLLKQYLCWKYLTAFELTSCDFEQFMH